MFMILYSALLTAVLVLGSPWWLWRMATSGRYRAGLSGRLGLVPAGLKTAVAGKDVVWVHCVSVGEVLGAARLIAELQAALPGYVLAVSTTTQTGQEIARQKLPGTPVFYMPLDLAFIVRRYLNVLRPKLLVLMESELWPRLLVECERRRIPVAVVNARISDRSFPRYMKLRHLWKPLMAKVTLFLAQGEETAERLRAIGAPPERVQVSGNLKFEITPAETPVVQMLKPLFLRRTVVIGGSLLEPEESILLRHWGEILRKVPNAILALAPRHKERFEAVAKLAAPISYRVTDLLRQTGSRPEKLSPCAIVVLDTLGDLAALYALADVAFVGGSLVSKGGHNPLEPARFGIPIIMGPSGENFREIVDGMNAEDGIRIVSEEYLAATLIDLLTNPEAAKALGENGRRFFESRTGATGHSVTALLHLLSEARS